MCMSVLGVSVQDLLKKIYSADKKLWEELIDFKDVYGAGRLETFLVSVYRSKDSIAQDIKGDYENWRSAVGNGKDSKQFQKYLIAVTGIDNRPVLLSTNNHLRRRRRRLKT